ncbi:DUF748 domain-containing protein [Dyella sp. GSA-30]|uniref:DUF748 domain-containing protein n=1 Tax=Dyella sp. GSA-30 TaxID=2994496 RepID=UPI002492D727|nr:DUF748 domain-containing protein [Dyella sp. GSA-30]BDU20764.1 hypothetical protein DYGSA30_22210 [Dyella sp. GSA-30]
MNDPKGNSRLAAGRDRAVKLYRSHRLRKTLLILLGLIVLFGVLGFFAAPSLIKSQLQSRATAMLGRPVTVDAIHLNPYTLRLELDKLHIGEKDGTSPFVDIDQIVVNASWAAVFRLTPVLDELTVQHPQIHITRTAPQTFNFSDLLDRFAAKPGEPPSPPTRFALANISVHNGDIQFDDKVLNAKHRVDQLELGIPFIANLPSRVDVYVQPLLAMRVDNSPLRIDGQTKPFADSRESTINFKLDQLDLPRYLSYVPSKLPVDIPSGVLSGQLQLHFLTTKDTSQLRLDGSLAMDNFKLANHDNTPLLELGRATATLNDVEPLSSRYHLSTLSLERANLHYTKLPGGHSNFDALTAPAPPTNPPAKPTQVRIDTLSLEGSRLDYADLSGKTPARLALENLHGSLRGVSTVAGPAGSVDMAGQMAGGQIAANGKIDLVGNHYVGKVSLKQVALATLVPLAPPMLNGEITDGAIDADAQLQASWGSTLNVHMEPAQASLNHFALSPKGNRTTPVAWQGMHADIAKFDMAGGEARLNSLTLSGLKVDVRRLRNGSFDLASLMLPSKPAPRGAAASPSFHWSVAHFGLDDGTVNFKDDNASGKKAALAIKASKFGVDGLSDNMRQPLKLDLNGGIGKGTYNVIGTVKPEPLDADLRVKTTRLDIAQFESLISVPLNVRIVSAQLGLNGHVRYADRGKQPARIAYQGQATLGRVRVLDKATDDEFLRWNSLTASGMNVRMGEGAPHVNIGALSLSDFYARVIINATGRINLQDVVANPAEATPVSVTRAQDGSTPAPAPAASTAQTAQIAPAPASSAPAGPPPEIQVGQVTVSRGQLNYTDNFIKPNYTANITQLEGKVGAFGTTAGGPPADLNLNGQLDDNAPVDIAGSINPLAPVAFLDIKAKADGVELTHLSPYSGKYAGYPITKGRLNVDVHYLLDQGKLTADNHIFIDQLTFGDRIEGPGVSHLPVKLAVALLKDSQGRIDVHVPVSGSLNDPKFSVGGLIWRAIVNLIAKAATAPFKLLASAFGGGGNGGQDLGYVEFAPGSSVLTADSTSRLEKIVKVLNDKSSLNLDIIGREDPAYDEKGLRHEMVEDLIRHEAGNDEDNADPAKAKMTPEDRDHYLEKAYKHAKFKKERNLVGLTKSQPPEEMQKLLEENMPVDQDALRHLAERRADVVRQWLRGKVPDSRVFVSAPKVDAKGIDDGGKTTRVDFGLH